MSTSIQSDNRLMNQYSDEPKQVEEKPIVFIVDDNDIVRQSLTSLVKALGMETRSYASGEAFLRDYDSSAGCLITDVRMPEGMSGMELQQQLIQQGISLPVIIITAFAETSLTVQAMQRGAVTLLEKPYRDHELLDAIQTALRQDRRHRSETAETDIIFGKLSTLSKSESDVLNLIIDGLTNKVIAKRLDVSIRTIENRRQRIYEKMNTDSVADLVRMVVEARTKRQSLR